MGIFSWLLRSRDKPTNSHHFSGWPFAFGKPAAGAKVNEFTAMQTTAVYACVRILAESVASLPLHVYEYKGQGKERVPGHPLYRLLHRSRRPQAPPGWSEAPRLPARLAENSRYTRNFPLRRDNR